MVSDQSPAILDAIGALNLEGKRDAERRSTGLVAQQRGEIDGLAGSINAAFGKDVGIEFARRGPTGNAAIGQIERRRFQAQEAIVPALFGNQQGWGKSAL